MTTDIIDVSKINFKIDIKTEKIVRKQFIGLLLLTFCDFSYKMEITSFFDLWNITFPNDKQLKRRLSQYDILNRSNS